MMEQLNLNFTLSSCHLPLWTNVNDKWATMLWKKLEKNVLNIQKRIYKAIKAGKIGKAKKLARLLLRSTSSIILNVRRVTQDNKGKRTAGVDGVKMLTPKQRLEMVNNLILQAKKRFEGYKAKPIRRVYVPKPNGDKRPLGIPTMEDRAIQGIVKSSLEPIWEARFEPYSYGFRPAHSTHDAVELIFKSLRMTQKWVLEADIKGCFDNINHEKLLEKLDVTATQKRMIRQMLKAGCMDNQVFSSTELGTPQGGIISPVLANIALDGLETYLYSELSKKYNVKELYRKKLRLVRYADDFVILYPDKEVIIDSKRIIVKWLAQMELELSESKTKITHSSEGFDFLGFNVKQYQVKRDHFMDRNKSAKQKLRDFKLLIKPSKKAIKKHDQSIKEVLRSSKASTQDTVIKRLNPLIRGWANYYNHQVSKKTFSNLDYQMWIKLWSWSKRRHGEKSKGWIAKKYFKPIGKKKWCFATKENVLANHFDTKIVRHVMVKTGKSYYDGDETYWAKRLRRGYGNISPSKAKLLKKQNGKCNFCDSQFRNEDLMETHHVIMKKDGGKREYKNLVLIHKHCHDQLHGKK
jgi:RNA-directed DNA polymerase